MEGSPDVSVHAKFDHVISATVCLQLTLQGKLVCRQRSYKIEHCLSFMVQVFLFERDESGSWSYARALSSEPVLAFVTEAKKGQVSAEFSAKLAMFKSPMSKVIVSFQ